MEAQDRGSLLIVGASSDIGLELIRQMAAPGTKILAHYGQSRSRLESLRLELPGCEIVPIQADLAQPEQVEHLIKQTHDHGVLPDQIVHLAAPKFEYLRFEAARWDDFQLGFDVQFRSIVRLLQEFLPVMKVKKRGKVVVVLSSVTLNIPPAALCHYVTIKYALLGLVRSLAAEYSSKCLNINAVSPSMVDTAFLAKLPSRMVEIAAGQSPLGRLATAKEVAASVRFLLSSDANYITGVNLPICGGTAF